VPRDAEPRTKGVVDLLARDPRGRIVGGVAIEIEVDPEARPMADVRPERAVV